MMGGIKKFVLRGNFVILVALAVSAGLVSDFFWTSENILNVIRAASLIGVIAIGMNVVVISGGIDLSVGSVVALTGAMAAGLWVSGASVLVFLGVPFLVALSVGFANGALVSWFGLQPFVATLVMMTVARGAGLVYTGGQPVYADYPDFFMFLSRGTVVGMPFPALLFLAVAVLSWYLMKFRVFGREVYAIGANEIAARLSGINVGWVRFKCYLYCALLAGVSGLVLTSRMESGEPGQAGIFWELDAIAAVVIGGTSIRGGSGSVWGAFVGALMIGIVANMFNLLGVGPAWQQVAKGAIILVAVMLQAFSDRGGVWPIGFTLPSVPSILLLFKPIVIVAALLAVLNGVLARTTPSLFQIDLAKAPYTRAKNLELTRVYRRAIPLYEEVIARFPNSKYVLLSQIGIANSARDSGDLARAQEVYEELFEDLTARRVPEAVHLDILKNYASLLQETEDTETFEVIFKELELRYPDSDATREARAWSGQIKASVASGEIGIPENAPVLFTADSVLLPETVKLGDRFAMEIKVEANGSQSSDFSLMSSTGFWKGFKLIRAVPNPRSASEFWGRQAWSFAKLNETLNLSITLEAIKTGTFEFDLDVERSFEIIEMGIVKSITVEDQK